MKRSDADSLIALARRAIAARLDGEQAPPRPEALSGDADVHAGAFVTLRKRRRLRGCIGRIESEWPLWQTVLRMAQAAAFEDPRFDAVEKRDMEEIAIEISVLTPLASVTDFESIEVGRHGLVVEQGYNRGLLLPQVAVEQGWDRERFLDQTCVKANLPPDAWRDPATRVYAFSAEVFEES